MTDTLTFETQAAATEFFAGLSYRALPVRGARTLAADGFDDYGRPIVTFARQHLGAPLSYTLTEVVNRRRAA